MRAEATCLLVCAALLGLGCGEPSATPSPSPGVATPTPDAPSPSPTAALSCVGISDDITVSVAAVPGNHTLVEVALEVRQSAQAMRLRLRDAEGATLVFDLGDVEQGSYALPLFGLMPERAHEVDALFNPQAGVASCTAAAAFETRAVDPLGLPDVRLTGGEVSAERITGLVVALTQQTPRLGWLREGRWVSVWDLSALNTFGRRYEVEADGSVTMLNEVFTTTDLCQLVRFDVAGRVLDRQTEAINCHHSFASIDVDGDGQQEPLLLGLVPYWQTQLNEEMATIYVDRLEYVSPEGPKTLLSYESFAYVDQALLDRMLENYNPSNFISQDATYANTLQCTPVDGGHCLSGLNLSQTGLVHVDLGRHSFHVFDNKGVTDVDPGRAAEEALPQARALRWEGLEKLFWNQGLDADQRTPFSGLHSAQVLAYDEATQRLRFVTHDRGFNVEVLIFGVPSPLSPEPEDACAQTIVYEVDLNNDEGRVLSAAGERLEDGSCAHSLFMGDVAVERAGGIGNDVVTALYTGYTDGDPVHAVPPVLAAYEVQPDGTLALQSRLEADAAPTALGFHGTLNARDWMQRLVLAGLRGEGATSRGRRAPCSPRSPQTCASAR